MLVVSACTALALYIAQREGVANAEQAWQRQFEGELAAAKHIQEIRHAALVERCRALVRKSRIHAALEDNALDLLYPSAKEELRDVMDSGDDTSGQTLHAEFYRFLDRRGAVIAPPNITDVGQLRSNEEARLALPGPPDKPQLGYLPRQVADGSEVISEVIAMPIISTETGEFIAALVLGFKPVALRLVDSDPAISRGLWVEGRLHMATLDQPAQQLLGAEVTRSISASNHTEGNFTHLGGDSSRLLFYRQLNPSSHFPPAYEVCIYSLTELWDRQRKLRWQVLGAGALLLLAGLAVSHFLSGRLSRPVEKLAVDSEKNQAQRARAEAALEVASGELQRAARFSADASHQLKTPVTVLRAGLEELLAKDNHTPEECREVSALIHQTYRLSSVIEDLLLLSRMDAGRLKIDFVPVNLTQLIEASLDDLSALPASTELAVETEFPAGLHIAGEKRFTAIILQNLLENARKYNRPGGRIRITVQITGEWASLVIGNSGAPIPAAAQQHIFERFHRGAVGENVPGYGLGLNLARELARLHQGDLRLSRSDEQWTEFEVRFRIVQPSPGAAEGTA